jgi:hypothetical protein
LKTRSEARVFADDLFTLSYAPVHIRFAPRQQVFVEAIDPIEARSVQMSDRFPDVNWDLAPHAIATRPELCRIQFRVDVIIVEGFIIEMEIVAVPVLALVEMISSIFP